MKRTRTWLLAFAAFTAAGMIIISAVTVYIDPFMHYHKPLTYRYYYLLDNERSQNDGITKHFDYDGIITGTSEIENSRTSEAERIFGGSWIKVPYSGGMFKEINDNLATALETHPGVRYVVRCLDRYKILADKDSARNDMGEFPYYLYDSNPFNDIEYLFNRDVLYKTEYRMLDERKAGWESGITSFDNYANWMSIWTFGSNSVLESVFGENYASKSFTKSKPKDSLSDSDREKIRANVKQNVTDLADRYPETTFYYFLPPYSAASWGSYVMNGHFERQAEIEKLMIQQILPHKNIHLFAWNRFDLFDDLNNFKDSYHYAEWINSWMLVQMKNDSGRLTEDNYEEYLKEWMDHYMNLDYSFLFDQEDYEADYYAAGLLNHEISGAEPFHPDSEFLENAALQNASVISGQYENDIGLDCVGTMSRGAGSDVSVPDACYSGDYCGVRFSMDVTDYRAFTFYAKKTSGNGAVSVFVFSPEGKVLTGLQIDSNDLDDQWHQYAINLAGIYGDVTIVMNGGYTDSSGDASSETVFSRIVIY